MSPDLKKAPLAMLAMALCLMAPACGGGGGGDDDPPVDPDASVVVTDGGSGNTDAGHADAGHADAGETGGCGGIDEKGVCEGDVLKYCDRGTLETSDCAASGAFCHEDPVSGASCKTPGDPLEVGANCNVKSYAGSCQGEKRYYCDAGTVAKEDCGDQDNKSFCQLDGGAATCASCAGVNDEAYCVGTVWKSCWEGRYYSSTDCADQGQLCGSLEEFGLTFKDCILAPETPCEAVSMEDGTYLTEGLTGCLNEDDLVRCKNNVLTYVDYCPTHSSGRCSTTPVNVTATEYAKCGQCDMGPYSKPSFKSGECAY